ncbi:MAG: uracil-DNA glycosylase, partial [Clostridia bacterium]|nr:uracil-DNA glycosylase [Clostridia bacterium]
MVHFDNDWDGILEKEFAKDYYQTLRRRLTAEYHNYTIYPDMNDIFNAFKYSSYAETKAVIIGQDPYHEPNQAHGLSFSVKKGVPLPPSLQNIYKELQSDLGIVPPPHGDLSCWAKQGVLLLNATLTVRAGLANSHAAIGWQTFTDRVIALLNQSDKPIAFLLWGSFAQRKAELIDNPIHRIFMSPHPSPLSAHRGFFGSRPFSQINRFLEESGRWARKAIDIRKARD